MSGTFTKCHSMLMETKKCSRRKVLAFRKFPGSFKNRLKFGQNY